MPAPAKQSSKLERLKQRLEQMVQRSSLAAVGEALAENVEENVRLAELQRLESVKAEAEIHKKQIKHLIKHGKPDFELESKELLALMNLYRDSETVDARKADLVEYAEKIVMLKQTNMLSDESFKSITLSQLGDSKEVRRLKKLVNAIEDVQGHAMGADASLDLFFKQPKAAEGKDRARKYMI